MRLIVTLIALLSLHLNSYAQEERKLIRKGNEEYEKQNYAGSEAQFKAAVQKNNKSFEAQFNYADALYKLEKHDEALAAFQALAAKESDKLRLAAINHNIGNCHLALANKQQDNTNNQNNGASLDNAISSYKQSLRKNPMDNETRYNLIAAEKMKEDQKKEKEKEKQNQDQQQQQQDQQQEVSKQDAQRILEAMQEDEKKLQEKKKVKSSGRSSDKNW